MSKLANPRDEEVIERARRRGDETFTLVGQDRSSPKVIAFWILREHRDRTASETCRSSERRDPYESDPAAQGCGLTLDLYIPCRVDDKPLGIQPIHESLREDATGAARSRWRCPHCGALFFRRKPCTAHMGMIMNTPASCRVLVALDERRRMERKSTNA